MPTEAATRTEDRQLSLPLRLFKGFLGGLLRLLFRVEIRGLEHFHAAGDTAVIVVNHQSYLDAPLLASLLPEKVGFAINRYVAQRWWVAPWLTLVKVFRVDPTSPFATNSLIKAIRKGGKFVIFPEGRITETGGLMKVYEGPAVVADKTGASVLPIRLDGCQYTYFSLMGGKIRRRLLPKISITILPPRRLTLPETLKGRRRRDAAGDWLYTVMSETLFEGADRSLTVFEAILRARTIHGGNKPVLEDLQWQPMSYDRLITGSFVLGRKLAALTGERETVGVLLPNAAGPVVTWFALQAFGRTPAMLNYTAGSRNMITACQTALIKTVITSRVFIERAELDKEVEALGQAVQLVYLEDIRPTVSRWDKLRGLLDSRRAAAVHQRYRPAPEDGAVILFTSGSEGAPKGVVLSHENMVANINQLAARLDVTGRDVMLNVLPIFHSFGLTCGLFLPLAVGMKVFMYPSPLHYKLIPEIAYGCKATILFATNTFLAQYGRSAHPYDFFSLRYVFAGAEAVREETRRLWFEKFGIRILEGYGATETAPVAAVNTPMHYRSGAVGRLLPGMRAHIEAVEGIETGGRLHLAGPNIMRGYRLADKPGELQPPPEGWHDTGDIAALDQDGFLRIVGRLKRFAKIGGEMVSLLAAENLVSALWPEDQHGVVAVSDGRKGEQLVLVTTRRDADRSELVEHVQAQGYSELFIPRRILTVDDVPLLGTGKTDHVRVKAIAEERIGNKEAA